MVIADTMALFVDPVFAAPENFSTATAWVAMIAYALQIYCDFSGYSDMAIGSAHMLGYKLNKNFDLPYLAKNVAEFWRRWHISLSTWLRDYLYFTLGGSRGGKFATWRNLMITMVLCGLWHGAGWNFIVFGAIQGSYLIIHREFSYWVTRSAPSWAALLETAPLTVLRVALTFITFCLSAAVFRARTLPDGFEMLSRIVLPHDGEGCPQHLALFVGACVGVIIYHTFAVRERWRPILDRLPAPALGASYATALAIVLLLAPLKGKVFIYFQF